MKFFELRYFEGDQENPSIQSFRGGYDSDAENNATHIRYFKKIDFIPDLDFVLDPNGKATDLLELCGISSDYLCVSSKFYKILQEHALLRCQHFEAVVRDGGKHLPYHFFHFFDRFDSEENDLVDFRKTKFKAANTTFPVSIMATPTDKGGVLGEFQVVSWNEYHRLRDEVENDSVHKVILPDGVLYLKDGKFLELDLFYLAFNNFRFHTFVVSERLAKAIVDAGITGVKLEPLPYELAPS